MLRTRAIGRERGGGVDGMYVEERGRRKERERESGAGQKRARAINEHGARGGDGIHSTH
jgi:hypothetical protein